MYAFLNPYSALHTLHALKHFVDFFCSFIQPTLTEHFEAQKLTVNSPDKVPALEEFTC